VFLAIKRGVMDSSYVEDWIIFKQHLTAMTIVKRKNKYTKLRAFAKLFGLHLLTMSVVFQEETAILLNCR